MIYGTVLILEIEELGEGRVVTLETSSKTLIVDGFLSHNSYEVRSSRTLDKYIQMLKEVVHVSGTKIFGSFYHDTDVQVEADITSSVSID